MSGAMNQAHPAAGELERFLHGEASPAEKHAVVRHLLAGCRQCAAAILSVWQPPQARRPRRNKEA
jgi:hypothetical protein